jgi:hypothetical protein
MVAPAYAAALGGREVMATALALVVLGVRRDAVSRSVRAGGFSRVALAPAASHVVTNPMCRFF